MREASRLRTEVVCSHHNAILVFDCENAGSRNDGLSIHQGSQPRDKRGVGLDGLSSLDSLGEGVLDVVGPLVNRMGAVGIEGVVPLRVVH